MRNRWLAVMLGVLSLGSGVVAVLGPLWAGVLVHRTSATTVDQLVGADAAALLVVAPVCLVVAVLAWRGHRAAPALALAPAVYCVYTYTQYVLGQEYLDQPGNVERFFPLLLGLVVVGGAATVLAWTSVDHTGRSAPSRGLEVVAAVVLMLLVVFLVLGLHLPGLVDALGDDPQSVGYLSSPTAFWVVKYMDLGLLIPVAVVTAAGLLRRRAWARTPMYAVLGSYTLIGTSVLAMALVMLVRDDPDASVVLAVGFGAFTGALWLLSAALYRPLFRESPNGGPFTRPASRARVAAAASGR